VGESEDRWARKERELRDEAFAELSPEDQDLVLDDDEGDLDGVRVRRRLRLDVERRYKQWVRDGSGIVEPLEPKQP
jgi:hypothetical protein